MQPHINLVLAVNYCWKNHEKYPVHIMVERGKDRSKSTRTYDSTCPFCEKKGLVEITTENLAAIFSSSSINNRTIGISTAVNALEV